MQKIRSQLRKPNICVEAEKPAGSRVLLTQHPRPSRFSAHDPRYAPQKMKKILFTLLIFLLPASLIASINEDRFELIDNFENPEWVKVSTDYFGYLYSRHLIYLNPSWMNKEERIPDLKFVSFYMPRSMLAQLYFKGSQKIDRFLALVEPNCLLNDFEISDSQFQAIIAEQKEFLQLLADIFLKNFIAFYFDPNKFVSYFENNGSFQNDYRNTIVVSQGKKHLSYIHVLEAAEKNKSCYVLNGISEILIKKKIFYLVCRSNFKGMEDIKNTAVIMQEWIEKNLY